MGKFDKVKTNTSAIAKTEAMKSSRMAVENILLEDLVYDPNNNEDISHIDELVRSIQKHGFTHPILVTDFGMDKGKYRIVAGHRRTEAMKFLNEKAIPCVVAHYTSEEEVAAVREADNGTSRDSIKDPLLWVRRWSHFADAHENLSEGEKVKEFALNNGLGESTIQRFKAIAKLVEPLQKLIVDNIVGYSALTPAAKYSAEDQLSIYNILIDAMKEDEDILTRPNCKKIIDAFGDGVKDWHLIKDDIFAQESTEKTNAPISHGDKNDYDRFAGIDISDEDSGSYDSNEKQFEESRFAERETTEYVQDSLDENEFKNLDTQDVAAIRFGKDLVRNMDKLKNIINRGEFSFSDSEEGKQAIANMLDLVSELLIASYNYAINVNEVDLWKEKNQVKNQQCDFYIGGDYK